MPLFKVVDAVKTGLDATVLRHKVLSNNIANVNTPHFRRSDIDFSAFLASQNSKLPISTTHRKHLSGRHSSNSLDLSVSQETGTIMGNDQNNVDIDREMALVLENQIHYLAMTDAINRNLSLLRSAINEGRR